MARKLIAADLSSAEARIFAHFSGDKGLQDVYRKGEDLYSRIAVDVFGRSDLSAHPDDDNYVKKVDNDLRQQVKCFTLAVPYGAEGFQVAASMGYYTPEGKVDSARGQALVDKYLSTYPNLRKYMIRQELMFKKHGYVRNLFGRIRRFDQAHALYKKYGDQLLDVQWAKRNNLKLERSIVKKALNAAKNFPIQSTCASLINRAMVEMGIWLENNPEVDARLLLMIHDEVCYDCDEEVLDLVSEKISYYMENNKYVKYLDVPLIATPVIGDNLAECK